MSNSILEIKKFIKINKIPYTATWAAMHCFSTADAINAGSFGVAATRFGNFALQKADLILFLGTRLSTQIVGGNLKNFAPNAKKIIVEIDKEELTNHRLPKIDLKYNCDVLRFIKDLNNKKITINAGILKKWKKEIFLLKKNYPILSKKNITNKKFVDPYYFFNQFYLNIKKDSIVIPDASANLIWAYQSLNTDKNPDMFTAFNHSPMGYSIAASVGAYLGSSSKKNFFT